MREVAAPAAGDAVLSLTDHTTLLLALAACAYALATHPTIRAGLADSMLAVWWAWLMMAAVFGVAAWRGGR